MRRAPLARTRLDATPARGCEAITASACRSRPTTARRSRVSIGGSSTPVCRLQFHSPAARRSTTIRPTATCSSKPIAPACGASFLATEDDFQFVKSLQARDRIVPVVGDLERAATRSRDVGRVTRRAAAASSPRSTRRTSSSICFARQRPAHSSPIWPPAAPGGERRSCAASSPAADRRLTRLQQRVDDAADPGAARRLPAGRFRHNGN